MSDSRQDTGLLLVDPYNDFLSEGGKLTGLAKPVADRLGTLANLRARRGPRARPASACSTFRITAPGPTISRAGCIPAPISWVRRGPRCSPSAAGEEWHPDFQPQAGDVVVQEHWGGSGFANTDLDLQLKQHGVRRVIVVGLLANTCIEATSRFAAELGYHVTLVRDATAAFSEEALHAAHEINGPTFAHAIVTTAELLGELV